MSALFNLCVDGDEPPYVQLDTLAETHGIEPAHVIADHECPIIVILGSGRYLSRKDLDWLLHLRAEEALARRRSGTVPEPHASTSDLADAVRKATGERFYPP